MIAPKSYRACRRSVFWFFVFAFGLEAGFKSLLHAVSDYVAQSILIISDMVFASLLMLSVIVFPIYILVAKYEVSSKDVRLRKGVVILSHQYVPLSSVTSVTTVTTPLSVLTGFNFVVLNSPGAKSIMPFVTRRQAREISSVVNDAIRHRLYAGGGEGR
jgi:membrane protein YdbS with pleckstrin-like domain